MFGWEIGFDRPWYLLLLLLLPVLWICSYHSLSGLGNLRRLLALGLRTMVLVLIVVALAEIQLLRVSEKLTVIYLLDQSQSIPAPKRQRMLEYVSEEVKKHRNRDREDRAGVIVFAADAKIEIPPFDDNVPEIGSRESTFNLRTDATNLEVALKRAQAAFPEDSAKRVVIVTDGNENSGNARAMAKKLAGDGVGIDVVPIMLESRAEVAVEKVVLPADVRKGQTFETRVVVNSDAEPTADNPKGLVTGKLRLTQYMRGSESLIDESDVTLEPGKNVFGFRHEIDEPAMFTYKAIFTPSDESQDTTQLNNEATAYTHVRGEGHVLFIEDWENRGEFQFLIDSLRSQNLEVTVKTSDQAFSSPVELLEYDTVVLANVPRSSGTVDRLSNFDDSQIRMLVKNTEQFGCGIVMIGGERSFGAGGWANTELEKAMPVDFNIKNDKVSAIGALVLMMHASEMAQGNHWQKVVARESIKALGPMDYCGLVHWDNNAGKDDWLWAKPKGLVRVTNRRKTMLSKLDRMAPGDMPEFEPSMKKAMAAFGRVNASVKHMIVISDGDPSPPTARTIRAYIDADVHVTTVAVGAHGAVGHRTLQQIARQTGGKYYKVNNPKALPKIYQREVRTITRKLIYEPDGGLMPVITYPHEILGNLQQSDLQPLRGYVYTTLKENALVEQALISNKPDDGGKNSTLLATWNYGLGRTVVFTSDAGSKWADGWTSAEYYDKFFGDMIRWSMRPIKNEANFTVASQVRDGKVRVVIDALDKDDEYLDFLNMSAQALGPDLEPIDVQIRQESSGRYIGTFDSDKPGSYLFVVSPGGEHAPIRGGVNVPYSSEFRDRDANEGFLTSLASYQPDGGEKGILIKGDMTEDGVKTLLEADTFRHNLKKAISSQDVWPLIVLVCGMLFFADVFVRRVAIGFDWIDPMMAWVAVNVLGRGREEVPDERMSRLQSQKQAISNRIDERRAATRFEPQQETEAGTAAPSLNEVLDEVQGTSSPAAQQRAAAPPPTSAAAEEDTYTERLLKAKRKALNDRDEN